MVLFWKNQVVQKAGETTERPVQTPQGIPGPRALLLQLQTGRIKTDPGILILFLVSGCKGPNCHARGCPAPCTGVSPVRLAGLLSF